MDYSLGKHVTFVARWVIVVVILLSPALVFAQGKYKSNEQTAKSLDILFAQFEGPPVEIPAASDEALVDIPADAPLVGDQVATPSGPAATPSNLVTSPVETSKDVQSPAYVESMNYGRPISEVVSVVPESTDGPVPVFSTGSWFWNGRWYLSADYVVLTKEAPSERLVAYDRAQIPPTGPNDQFGAAAGGIVLGNVLSTDTETHAFESGARITFGKFLGRDAARRDHMVDFTFFGFFDWLAQAELVGQGSIASGLPAADLRSFSPLTAPLIDGFFNNDRQSYRYSSDFDSFAANYRIQTRPGRDQMAIHPSGVWTRHASSGQLRGFSVGLRGISINEGFLVEAFTETDRNGMYQVRTGNDLFGPQIGFDVLQNHDLWHWGFRSQLGTLVNFADRRSIVETLTEVVENGVPREVIVTRAQLVQEEQMAFLGQLGLYGAVHLRPNLSMRIAYDFMYITGLAIAPNNARLGESFPGFQTTGDALYHGASFGFVSRF